MLISPHGWTAKQVRALRGRLGLSQEAFAHRLGVSFTTVNRWERGKVVPRGSYADRLEELRYSVSRAGRFRAVYDASLRPGMAGFESKRVVIPSDQVFDFGGPTVAEMQQAWGRVPASVLIEAGDLKPVW